jgi:hypothetical protein
VKWKGKFPSWQGQSLGVRQTIPLKEHTEWAMGIPRSAQALPGWHLAFWDKRALAAERGPFEGSCLLMLRFVPQTMTFSMLATPKWASRSLVP